MRKRISSLTLALVMIFGIVFLLVPGEEANALPKNRILILYYSDATLQTEVGWRFIGCTAGGSSTGGEVTEFLVVDEVVPCDF